MQSIQGSLRQQNMTKTKCTTQWLKCLLVSIFSSVARF
jgi:hypothetical protein